MKVQISINDELLQKIDLFCKENYMSRSGFLSFCAQQELLRAEVGKTAHILRNTITEICEGRDLTEAQQKELDDTLAMLNLITEKK